jgi:hypothetical protein
MALERKTFRGLYKRLAITVIAMALFVGGCKTQEDAAAAAKQMASTSRDLSAYYLSLDHILAETQDSYQAQFALQQVPPEDLSETRAQIRLRADMADEIGNVSALFQKIAGSSAASDASASAANLNAEIVSLKGLTSNDAETQMVTTGIKEIVALIQQHEEVQAARKVGPLCHNLSIFFDSEKASYLSIQEGYLKVARSVSKGMVNANQVDTSPVFLSALQPFGLAPAVDKASVKDNMQSYLLAQIEANYKLKLDEGQKAAGALSASLKEMDARIDLVAHDKPMQFREPPFSLETVKGWISDVNK